MTWAKTIAVWTCVGVGFNISQRVLDYLLDTSFKQVGLTWLVN